MEPGASATGLLDGGCTLIHPPPANLLAMFLYLLRLVLISTLIIAALFLPFLPGEYDPAAALLSNFAQAIGFSGILLIPIAIIWLVFGRAGRKTVRLTCAAAASVVITFAAVLGAAVNSSPYLAIGLLSIGASLSFVFFRRILRRDPGGGHFDPIPLYLIFIPLLVMAARFAFMGRAIELSRDRAIRNCEILIRDIEAFHARNGTYPVSLNSLWEDYKPGVIGISRYYYEPNGKAYNLYFEQTSDQIGVREIVMYNKLGEHRMHSHNQDRLRLESADQILRQGWLRVVDLPQENWKYFWFD